MKYSLLLSTLLLTSTLMAEEIILPPLDESESTSSTTNVGYPTKAQTNNCDSEIYDADECGNVLKENRKLRIFVTGQGVAPCDDVCSPAQAYALAKRAAITDAYRLVAEKVKGVYVEGEDYIKNMMVKRSTVRTSVNAMIRNANVVETTFKDGLCEVEMEVQISHAQF